MRIVNRKKFIARILEILIILGTIILTPLAINYANQLREYKALGGEYLIPLVGVVVLLIIETILEERKWENMGYQQIKELISDIDEFHNEAELREILQQILFICEDNLKNEPSTSDQTEK